jgi:hypothetical protein
MTCDVCREPSSGKIPAGCHLCDCQRLSIATRSITKETAKSANSVFHYKSDKLIKTGFSFRPIDETIAYTCTFLAN